MSFYLALLLGLLSSGHCAGMCGGLIGALNSSTHALRSPLQNQLHLTANNLGRITLYVLSGIAMGYLGASLGQQLNLPDWSRWLRLALAVMILLIGLQLLFKQDRLFQALESISRPLWRPLQKHLIKLHQSQQLHRSYLFGLLWGTLPCGLVYSVLLTATSSGSSLNGALTMLGFGLGTLPALLLTGNAFIYYKRSIGRQQARQASGAILIASALLIFASPMLAHYLGSDSHPLMIALSHCL